MSVYVSYLDESDSGDAKGPFVVCGYVAQETEWPEFSRRWASEVLQIYPSIPYLHMTELRSEDWRSKHGICREQGEEKIRIAIDIIRTSAFLRPFIGKINQADYASVRKRLDDKGYEYANHAEYADYPCYMTYAVLVMCDLASDGEAKRIVFNMDRKKYVGHYISENFKDSMIPYLHSKGLSHLANLVGDFVPLSMEDHMPLQAADVLSWHMRRFFCGALSGTDLQNAENLDNGKIRLLEMTKKELDQFGSELPEAGHEQNGK